MTFHAKETICMKCQILFSGKNKKNNINLSTAENAQSVVKVNFERSFTALLCTFYDAYICVKSIFIDFIFTVDCDK